MTRTILRKTLNLVMIAALLLGVAVTLQPAQEARAATFNLGCDAEALVNAVATAMGNGEADVINLQAGCTYTITDAVMTATGGPFSGDGTNAFPTINSSLTINGSGAVIERGTSYELRGFFVNGGSGSLTLNDLIVRNFRYTGGDSGGALRTDQGAGATINRVLFRNNASRWGGGILVDGNSTVNIYNSTFYENQATAGDGGAIRPLSGNVDIFNSTFVANTAADEGGAIAVSGGDADLFNSILYNNNVPNDSRGDDCRNVDSFGGNIISKDQGCNITATTGDQFDTDPLLDAFDGFTFPLQGTSPALDTALDANCANPTDQRGATRPVDLPGVGTTTCDSGAWEYQPPTASDDTATTPENTLVTIDLTTNDSADAPATIDDASLALPANSTQGGTISDNGDGTIDYTPPADYDGADDFTYTVDDSNGITSNSATVDITVTNVNQAPTAVDDTAATPEDTVVTIDLVNNDTDPDGDATIDPNTINVTDPPDNGALVDNGDGTVDYTPNLNFNGVDTFTYRISDSGAPPLESTNDATVTITVSNDIEPPVADNDTAATDEEVAVTINVAANDSDPDGTVDVTSVNVQSGPAHGSAVENGDGTVTYTPDKDFFGTDTFTYTIKDDEGAESNAATVTVTVRDVAEPATGGGSTGGSTGGGTGGSTGSANAGSANAGSTNTVIVPTGTDTDGDGIFDENDNCPTVPNADQNYDACYDSTLAGSGSTSMGGPGNASSLGEISGLPALGAEGPGSFHILTRISYMPGALPNGGDIFWRATPDHLAGLAEAAPDGYVYAWQPNHIGYFDVFGLDQNGVGFGTLNTPMDVCFRPAGVGGNQFVARFDDDGWHILPTSLIGGDLCAQSLTVGKFTLLVVRDSIGQAPAAPAADPQVQAPAAQAPAEQAPAAQAPLADSCQLTTLYNIHLRAVAGIDAAVVADIPFNTALTATRQTIDGWFAVSYNGLGGYVFGSNVTLEEGCVLPTE